MALICNSAITNPLLPGLFESLEQIINTDTQESSGWNEIKGNDSILLKKSKEGTSFFIAPEFLSSLVLNATLQQKSLLKENPCSLADLLWLNQLRHGNGKFSAIPLLYSPGKASYETLWVTREGYAKYLMNSKCKKSEEAAYLFSSQNLPNVMAQFDLPAPKEEFSCYELYEQNLKSSKTPYYCFLMDSSEKGELSLKLLQSNKNRQIDESNKKLILQSLKVKEMLGEVKYDYLQNLCLNLHNKEKFCSYFFSTDYWKKKAVQKSSAELLKPMCPDKEAKLCADTMNKSPSMCSWSMLNYPGLLPRSNCQESSTALNSSSLNFNYRDCPGKLDNSAITNAGRILLHFGYDKILFAKSKKPQPPDQLWDSNLLCSSNIATAFLDFTFKIDWESAWSSKICFIDRLQRKNFCTPYVISNNENSAFSLTNSVSEILKKANRMDKGYTCKTISNKQYDNKLLKFKTGCWILLPEQYEITSTLLKVVVDDREFKDVFTLQGNVMFPYTPFNTQTDFNNFQFKLEKELDIKPISIKTISGAELHLKRNQAIIHGTGCAEELLPDYFRSFTINQCTPLSFIISGLVKSENITDIYAVVHSSIDEVAAPRLISWQQIIFSVEAYQKYHPQLYWSLYGLSR